MRQQRSVSHAAGSLGADGVQYLLPLGQTSLKRMATPTLDEIDRAILHALQEDARNNTNTEISDRVSVSPSTVGKRIARLEDEGIIKGHRSEIDYEKAGFPIQVLFICTAEITDREALIHETFDIEGVITVRELMTGEHNVHIQVVGTSYDDINRIAHDLDEMGYAVSDEIMLRAEYAQPSVRFAVGSSPD